MVKAKPESLAQAETLVLPEPATRMEGRRHNSTVTTMVIKELIGREPASGVYLTKQGRAMLEALL
jgi:hypothetical protein